MDFIQKQPYKTHLPEQIANLLEEEIVKKYQEGDRLASEQQLAERFEVSRTIVREALKILKARGLIDSRTGSGAYITRPDVQDLSDMISRIIQMDKINYESVYEVRFFLEAAAGRKAVELATEEDFDQLEELLAGLRNRNIGVLERRDLDFQFHLSIAQLSGNPLLVMLVQAMGNVFKEIIKIGIFIEGSIDDGIIRHQRILDALRLRDSGLVERMVFEHLEQSQKNYAVYLEKDKT